MKIAPVARLVSSVLLAVALASSARANETAPAAQPIKAERAMVVSASATVTAINLETREVTLKGEGGREITLAVDTRVQRLNEVKVGDVVAVDYLISIAGELRAPTEAEKANPLVIVEGAAKAPEGTSPAAGALRTIKALSRVPSWHELAAPRFHGSRPRAPSPVGARAAGAGRPGRPRRQPAGAGAPDGVCLRPGRKQRAVPAPGVG
jgi:DNA-binding protein